jgi:hypothetical protein
MAKVVRSLVSLFCLPVIYAAVLVFPCGSVSFNWPSADVPVPWACSESGSGAISGQAAAVGMSVAVLLILIVVWLPVVKRYRSKTRRMVTSLAENLPRAIAETDNKTSEGHLPATDDHGPGAVGVAVTAETAPQSPSRVLAATERVESDSRPRGDSTAEATTSPALRAALNHLRARVDLIEQSIAADTLSPREATHYWIGLLKECNDAHNHGMLPTSVFKELNTRLLDLFTNPTNPKVSETTADNPRDLQFT